ncbi:hypothetical protein CHS0354_035061 [Potamilus streckersoni]|uniref:Coactosin-like protein n=1 Tax=Potamilus streckersoni TaxID=2493646 RepID=A0AAE0S827_9BIVA|nr:hypothetical protein CHS0354_035061 [Potamilus streckersoni]
MTLTDKNSIREAYDDVRDDKTETNWCILKYEGDKISLESRGVDMDEFRSHFTDDQRVFGFVRMYTGDELSRRAKFALISWVGHDVGALKRAKMSTDKAAVKDVIKNFAAEYLASEKSELSDDYIRDILIKAGGANYGTGSRE